MGARPPSCGVLLPRHSSPQRGITAAHPPPHTQDLLAGHSLYKSKRQYLFTGSDTKNSCFYNSVYNVGTRAAPWGIYHSSGRQDFSKAVGWLKRKAKSCACPGRWDERKWIVMASRPGEMRRGYQPGGGAKLESPGTMSYSQFRPANHNRKRSPHEPSDLKTGDLDRF